MYRAHVVLVSLCLTGSQYCSQESLLLQVEVRLLQHVRLRCFQVARGSIWAADHQLAIPPEKLPALWCWDLFRNVAVYIKVHVLGEARLALPRVSPCRSRLPTGSFMLTDRSLGLVSTGLPTPCLSRVLCLRRPFP